MPVTLPWRVVRELDWAGYLPQQVDESWEELEEDQPRFRFFPSGEDEIESPNSPHSDGFVSIGETGVSEDWDGFLEEVDEARNRAEEGGS
jgi:hypothetical protein